MKDSVSLVEELEKTLMTNISNLIFDILGVKFQKQISEITRIEMKDIIQYHINETVWIDQIKENLRSWIIEYQRELTDQSKQLNMRMDFLEQRFLDFMRKIETEYSKKAVFAHIAGEL